MSFHNKRLRKSKLWLQIVFILKYPAKWGNLCREILQTKINILIIIYWYICLIPLSRAETTAIKCTPGLLWPATKRPVSSSPGLAGSIDSAVLSVPSNPLRKTCGEAFGKINHKKWTVILVEIRTEWSDMVFWSMGRRGTNVCSLCLLKFGGFRKLSRSGNPQRTSHMPSWGKWVIIGQWGSPGQTQKKSVTHPTTDLPSWPQPSHPQANLLLH